MDLIFKEKMKIFIFMSYQDNIEFVKMVYLSKF